MKNLKAVILPVLPVLTAFFLFGTALQAQEFSNVRDSIHERTLSNGMKCIVMERHEAPVASFHVYVDAGAANESYGITGISHLLEHMAFKGTKTIGTSNYSEEAPLLDQMDEIYEEIMAQKRAVSPDTAVIKQLNSQLQALQSRAKDYVINNEIFDLFLTEGDAGINAYTSSDATQYINSLPSNRLEFWMAVTSDRFLNPVFREFYKEKNVVMEERRMAENNPIQKLVEDFLAAAFKAHPYHHSVLGHMSDLEQITRDDVKTYFRTYYSPGNMAAAIVGDVDPDEVFRLAELYFGRLEKSGKPAGPRTREPEQWGERQTTVYAQSQPVLITGYHRPKAGHPDNAALNALANIIGEGRSSRLHEVLVKDKKIAVQTGAFNGLPGDKYPNLIAFLAVPSQGHTSEECLAEIDAQIELMKQEPVSAEELLKYKRSVRKSQISSMQSNAEMAAALTNAEIKLGSWREVFRTLQQVDALTAADIQRAASVYLNNQQRTIGKIVTEQQ